MCRGIRAETIENPITELRCCNYGMVGAAYVPHVDSILLRSRVSMRVRERISSQPTNSARGMPVAARRGARSRNYKVS